MRIRPTLEILEDRTTPTATPMLGIIPLQPLPAAAPAGMIAVTVPTNAAPIVIDLDAYLGSSDVQMAIVGNSNPGLAKPFLSDGELTIKIAPGGQYGTANITIGVTNADWSSVRETITVIVLPPR